MSSRTATLAPAPVGLFAPRLRAMTVGSVALVSLLAFEALAVGTAMPTVARSWCRGYAAGRVIRRRFDVSARDGREDGRR
ncbi:hypothetical protein ACLQ24_02125 [Micromonospora sp. DT4]|uniref:hypothetical protein n=1 Tax=Micromonospora sp. DT4 TaxID=3393438 RepID=UPI003CEDAB1C